MTGLEKMKADALEWKERSRHMWAGGAGGDYNRKKPAAKRIRLSDMVMKHLKRAGPSTAPMTAESLGHTCDAIRNTLNNMQKRGEADYTLHGRTRIWHIARAE